MNDNELGFSPIRQYAHDDVGSFSSMCEETFSDGLSYVQVDKKCITILYHLHQCTCFPSRDISC